MLCALPAASCVAQPHCRHTAPAPAAAATLPCRRRLASPPLNTLLTGQAALVALAIGSNVHRVPLLQVGNLRLDGVPAGALLAGGV